LERGAQAPCSGGLTGLGTAAARRRVCADASMKRIRTVAAELVRRKVVRVVGIYLVVYAGAIATIVTIAPAFQIPLHWLKWPIVGGAVLIPVLAALAWRYEILPPQLIRDA